MNEVIVYTREDGGISIVIPSPEYLKEHSLQDLIDKDIPKGAPYRIVSRDKLPEDRTFRNAWTDEYPTETVDVHMGKARDIHMNNLRKIRNAKLTALDTEHIRAYEQNDTASVANIVSKKQELRDMPNNFDLTQFETPEALKAAMPDCLK